MFGAGCWGGFIQIGVGFILMPILHRVMGLDLVRTNMHKVFIALSYNLVALAIFASLVSDPLGLRPRPGAGNASAATSARAFPSAAGNSGSAAFSQCAAAVHRQAAAAANGRRLSGPAASAKSPPPA
jgi:hypothetical protein